MIKGRFGAVGRPFLEAKVFIRSLKISGDVSFLVDTGADNTVLMEADSARLAIDHRRLTERIHGLGIGGETDDYQVDAIVVFRNQVDDLLGYSCKLVVAQPTDTQERRQLPSLLGRNVLDRWKMTYDPRGADLSALPYDWDFQMPTEAE